MKNQSLSVKALTALLLILLPILVVFIIGYIRNREQMERHVLEEIDSLAAVYDDFLARALEGYRDKARLLAAELASAPDPLSPGRFDAVAGGHGTHIFGDSVETILVADADGAVLASLGNGGVPGEDMAAVVASLAGKGPAVAQMRVGSDGLLLLVSAPLGRGAAGEAPPRTLVVALRAADLEGLIGSHAGGGGGPRAGRYVYIVDRDGGLVAGEPPRRRPHGGWAELRAVRACIDEGRSLVGFFGDAGPGSSALALASRCLDEPAWVLIVEGESASLLAAGRIMLRDAVAAAVVVASLVGMLFILFHRNVVRRLHALAAATAEISRGNFEVELPPGPGDEIGALSAAFNDMAAAIRRSTEALRESEARLRNAQRIAGLGTWEWHIDSGEFVCSDESRRICGCSPGEGGSTYEKCLEMIRPCDRVRFEKAVERARFAGEPLDVEVHIDLPGGAMRYVHIEGEVTRDAAGRPVKVSGTIHDITEHVEAQEKIRTLASIPEESPSPVLRVDKDGVLLYANAASRLFMEEEGFELGRPVPQGWRERFREVFEAMESREFEVSSGGRTYSFTLSPVPEAGYINVYGLDITERRRVEAELRKLSTVIDKSINIVFITDRDGIIEYVNPVFETVTGFSRREAVGRTPRILSSSETPEVFYRDLWKTIKSGRTWRGIFKNRKKSGEPYWANGIITPIMDDNGEITHFLAVQEDITDKLRTEEKIRSLASYDSLTGLLNRRKFVGEMDRWIASAKGRSSTAALLVAGLDEFRFINDTYGHAVGDDLLKRVAMQLRVETFSHLVDGAGADEEANRPFVGRLGGDEFAVFVPLADAEAGLLVAEEICRKIESMPPVQGLVVATVSIGVSLYPGHGESSKELLKRAGAALYRAKELGRNRAHLYRSDDRYLEEVQSRFTWKRRLQKALEEDSFEPWFQPILTVSDGSVNHYEVLARMRDEHGKVMLPGLFINMAERLGYIGAVDKAVKEKALNVLAEFRRRGRNLSFAMNLSGKVIGDEKLLDYLKRKIDETDVDSSSIVFEITETEALKDMDKAIRFIKALKSMGCLIALDDFGVGFTSFFYLKELPVDFIKIDGSFIKRLDENPEDQLFVKAIVDVARGLHIKTVAEFVEKEATFELLRTYGVDYAQGYLIGRPAPHIEHSPFPRPAERANSD